MPPSAIVAATSPSAMPPPTLVAPIQAYVEGNAFLRVRSFCSQAGVTLAIVGRVYDLDLQTVVPFSPVHVCAGDRSEATTYIGLGRGYLLSVAVRAAAGTPLVGRCYVLLELTQSRDQTAQLLGVFTAGAVTARQGIAWPGSPIVPSTDVEPAVLTLDGTLPAIGAEFLETVPTGARWEFFGLELGFTASAAVASRGTLLRFQSSGTDLAAAWSPHGTTASGHEIIIFARDVQQGDLSPTSGFSVAPLPRVKLLAGQTFLSKTINMDAADQYTAPHFTVHERLEVS